MFSCLGIQLAVNFFLERGHVDITVFVPSWRKEQPRPDVPITGENKGMHLVSETIPAVQKHIPISKVCFLIATKWLNIEATNDT